ncbi:MAG: hypothetical protein JXR37_05030 [Kiritimatiellae bacterium]|nr:hypothetical protein [Kiritimatiellia bacterium]
MSGAEDQAEDIVSLSVRGEEVEISPDLIRYKGETFDAGQIDGLRFGGDEGGTWTVGIRQGEREIEIRCDGPLRTEGRARSDLQAIVHALYAHVVPGLIGRFAGTICEGGAVQIGNCTLNEEGVIVHGNPFGSGEQERKFVPYADLACRKRHGVVELTPIQDTLQVRADLSAQRVWNAVLLGNLIELMKQVKREE